MGIMDMTDRCSGDVGWGLFIFFRLFSLPLCLYNVSIVSGECYHPCSRCMVTSGYQWLPGVTSCEWCYLDVFILLSRSFKLCLRVEG